MQMPPSSLRRADRKCLVGSDVAPASDHLSQPQRRVYASYALNDFVVMKIFVNRIYGGTA